jgi:hypothetical protein
MTAANLDAADLIGVADGGLIKEDVMSQIWDISKIPLPFTDLMGSDTSGNPYTEWTQDRLQVVDLTNAAIDGADSAGNDSNTGLRVGNHHQISTKAIQVSTRAIVSDTIGFANTLSYQVMMRQRELRRDVEAIMMEQTESVADTGAAPGISAGFPSWLTSSVEFGVGGVVGGYGATSPTIVDAPTPGAARALAESLIRDVAQSIYDLGGNPSTLMCTTAQIRSLSEYMFTSSARIATLTGNTSSDGSTNAQVAKGSVNVFVTDFGVVLTMVANRLQQTHVDAVATQVNDVFLIDPAMVRQSLLHGYRTEPLAKTGLSDKRQIIVDWTLKVLNQEAHGMIMDCDPALPTLDAPP